MSAARVLEVVGRSELETAGAKLALSKGLTADEAAALVLDQLQPDDEAMAELIHIGLTRGIQSLLDSDRKMVAAADPVRVLSARQAAVAPSRVIGDPLELMLVGADGVRRALLKFSLLDWRSLQRGSAAQVAAFLKRKNAASTAIGFLVSEGVETTDELSAASLARLRPIVKAAWS